MQLLAALHSCAGDQALNQESRVCVICGPWDFSDCSGIIHSACKGNRGHHEVDQVTDALVFLKAAVYQHKRNNLVGSVISVLQIQELLCWFLGFEVYF